MFKKILKNTLIIGAGFIVGYCTAAMVIGIDNELNGHTIFENDDIVVRGTSYYDDHGYDLAHVYDKRKDVRRKYSK